MIEHYDLWLVALSFAVAVLASYTTLDIALRVRDPDLRHVRYWLLGGGIALGLGIWSMHFIGMLAHELPTPVGYDPLLTALSILPAVAAATLALYLFRCHADGRTATILQGGILIGAGIALMHYTGMAALRMSPPLHYAPVPYLQSWAIAILAAMAALALGLRLHMHDPRLIAKKFLGAGLLGVAIAGMHYTGMAAARFAPQSESLAAASGIGESMLAVAVGLGSFTILIITLLITAFDARLVSEHVRARRRLEAEMRRRLDRERQLEHLALHDQLTGLANRTFFQEELSLALRRAGHAKSMLGILAVDLDGFKEFNDGFGHAMGDAVLCDAAQRLRIAVGSENLVARFGGDEFIVLVSDVASPETLAGLAQHLLDMLGQVEIGSTGLTVSGSVGIALFPQDGATVDDLLSQADFALYHAKQSGKGCYRFFDGDLEGQIRSRQRLLGELRAALDHDQLTLFYQPQVDPNTGRTTGVEALVRWEHPREGLLTPGDFIPLAEEAGIMPAVDAWVIRRACRDTVQWRREGCELELSLNVSAQSVAPALVRTVAEVLEETGLPAEALELELTETTLLDPSSGVVEALQQLADCGVRLAIDDFGTGYGSLLYLRSLPVHSIKIDRCFVQAAPDSPQDAAIVAALFDLGRTLGLRVVAEGVETEAQLEPLRHHGCETVQGYWYCRPLSLPELRRFLRLTTRPELPATNRLA